MRDVARPRRRLRCALLAPLVLLASCSVEDDVPNGESRSVPDTTSRSLATVVNVVDGDTVDVALDEERVRVRLIGVDTPETVHPDRSIQCYGRAASAFTAQQLEGREVALEFDVEITDRYGRTLAYLWLDEELFNETLVAEGFATVATFPPNVQYVDRFRLAERQARADGRGLWGACSVGAPPGTAGDDAAAGDECHVSYPSACIPPPPPDLDCADLAERNFEVVGADPHGFDGDGDGVGCET